MLRDSLLIDAPGLQKLITSDSVLLFDCRFDLFHPHRGHNSWLAAHIPGAVYAHLDDHLAGRITQTSGRHPLPAPRSFAAFLARSGWTRDKSVVAYDGHGGIFASRLWWLMHYFGLPDVRILDGGIGAWMAASLPLESGVVNPRRIETPELTPDAAMVINSDEIIEHLRDDKLLMDARSANRFEGLEEPIDPVAGHIPGAVNRSTDQNLDENAFFKPGEQLKSQFRKMMGKQRSAEDVAHMCGSGVTACHNLFAMELAGMPGSRLYSGSWSEWIRDPARPVVKGAPS